MNGQLFKQWPSYRYWRHAVHGSRTQPLMLFREMFVHHNKVFLYCSFDLGYLLIKHLNRWEIFSVVDVSRAMLHVQRQIQVKISIRQKPIARIAVQMKTRW